MRLWTIQDEDVYNTIIECGKYRCDGSKSNYLESEKFKKAYDWLVEKMEERMGSAPEGVEYPVWAWPYKPDLRQRKWRNSEKKLVRIEFEIDEKDIFITDFFKWHFPLNGFLYLDIEDEDEWDDAYRKYCQLSFEEQERELKKSWEVCIYEKLPSDAEKAQITFWELNKDQIKGKPLFITR